MHLLARRVHQLGRLKKLLLFEGGGDGPGINVCQQRIFTSGGVCCLQSTRWTSGYREYPQATLLDFSSGRLSFCQPQLVGKDISVSPSVQFAPRYVSGQEIITREKD